MIGAFGRLILTGAGGLLLIGGVGLWLIAVAGSFRVPLGEPGAVTLRVWAAGPPVIAIILLASRYRRSRRAGR